MKDEYSMGLLQQDKFKKGKKEGLKEGQQQKALEIARSLLAKGIEPIIVAETTGLSPDELAALSS
jgi:predicted transposase/invertase (TIGR01784 family)